MSPSIDDVRNYIDIKPVPEWSESKNSKLKARSFNHYDLSLPTRERVFKINYDRRFLQRTSQGYQSYPGKPYQDVGHPLYLNSKLLVQTSLGQLSDNNSKDEIEKKENKENEEHASSAQKGKKQSRQMSTVSFVMKHKEHQDLQNLVKDLLSVQQTMAKVKMGHALFPMLEAEHNRRGTAFLLQKQEQMKKPNGMQPPSTEDKEGATTDLEDVLKQEFTREPPSSPTPKKMSLKRVGSQMAISVAQPSAASQVSVANPGMVAKKAQVQKTISEMVRPFTPFSSNIGYPIDGENSTESVWKQLCVVHWILLACEVEDNMNDQYQHKVMIPIIECWNKVNSGGRTRDSRVISQERKNNNKWTKFARNPSHRILARSKTRRKLSSFTMRRNASHASDLSGYQGERGQRPPSARSILGSLLISDTSADDAYGEYGSPTRPSSAGQSSVATTAGWNMGGSEFGDEDTATEVGGSVVDGRKESDLHERDYHEHLQKLLSTVGESVKQEMDRREVTAKIVAERNGTLPMSVYDWSRNSYFKIGNKEVNISKIVVPAATTVNDFSCPRPMHKSTSSVKIRPHTAVAARSRTPALHGTQDTPPSRPGTATGASRTKARPQSSPAKLSSQFLFKFSSEEKEKNLGQIREKFDEVNDSKALQLHNQLTELEKRRKQRMEIKFDNLVQTKSLHRDLKGMRLAAQKKFLEDQVYKKRHSCMVSCKWYTLLVENIPDEVLADSGCEEVLQKLFMMGMQLAEGMRVVTVHSFLSALRVLRPWELCSPEISSGIEFVREHIVGMKPEEFDEWRSSKLGHKEAIMGTESRKKILQN